MALCHNCDDARIEYIGNGNQKDYTFPFEYNENTDVAVAFWNEQSIAWEVKPDGWDFLNDTTIQFNQPPANLQKFIIYRCTDLDPLPAIFHPGHSIKAQDLNDNFFVLNLAIEEARCAIERQDQKAIERYWNKTAVDTVYYDNDWVSSDDTISTTKSQDQRFWNKQEQTTYMGDSWYREADDRHIPTTGAVDRHIQKLVEDVDGLRITYEEQITGAGEAKVSNQSVFSSAASIARHDAYVTDETPTEIAHEQPGKLWLDQTTLQTYIWDSAAGAWTTVSKTGSTAPGPPGPPGPSGTIIVSDDPPAEHPNGGPEGEPRALAEGDLWFNSETTQLFIYYKDNTGFQWVSVTAKGPKGDPGEDADGGPTYTFNKPLEESGGEVSLNLLLLDNA